MFGRGPGPELKEGGWEEYLRIEILSNSGQKIIWRIDNSYNLMESPREAWNERKGDTADNTIPAVQADY